MPSENDDNNLEETFEEFKKHFENPESEYNKLSGTFPQQKENKVIVSDPLATEGLPKRKKDAKISSDEIREFAIDMFSKKEDVLDFIARM